MKTFRALSALLAYPSAELQAAVPAIRRVIAAEGVIPPGQATALEPLLDSLATGDLYDLEERYVLLFDRSRSLSLNLFEHIHGESRDRGSAMVDLLETYRAGGFDLTGPELPDHLPVLLEFLSTQPLAEARAILADAGHILVALAERLRRRESLYAPVLAALVAIAQATPDSEEARALLAETDDDPTDLAALDATYAEAQVVFGPDPNAGCPAAREVLARMSTAPAPAPARAAAAN
ncbi:nitrate reductase molybdenum cofactor assembly chaperone [Paracoccus bogoriensis]|uniref:nitrate reductase molybdenum cofactor assembly chaperone n=1 Tax=Paracoccus bogoriensis TaxID=242065 RepID=UPI001CA4DB2F|nr:nitrate reductase molybdenum cofactor assembly chaperone [Paracoccus bogoriensis]MBW7057615.1 nitrate reductase molybdenum cofactor assembly chaperone [Paracoccus bogoriensis]